MGCYTSKSDREAGLPPLKTIQQVQTDQTKPENGNVIGAKQYNPALNTLLEGRGSGGDEDIWREEDAASFAPTWSDSLSADGMHRCKCCMLSLRWFGGHS